MALKNLVALMLAAICIWQVMCLPQPDMAEELSRAEASINNTFASWKEGFEGLFQDTNQLNNLLGSLGNQLQALSDNIANLTKNLEESVNATAAPPAS